MHTDAPALASTPKPRCPSFSFFLLTVLIPIPILCLWNSFTYYSTSSPPSVKMGIWYPNPRNICLFSLIKKASRFVPISSHELKFLSILSYLIHEGKNLWRTMSFLRYYWFNNLKKKKKSDIHSEFIPDGYTRIKVGTRYLPLPPHPCPKPYRFDHQQI